MFWIEGGFLSTHPIAADILTISVNQRDVVRLTAFWGVDFTKLLRENNNNV